MKPIGPLMREHRLIERMVGLLEKERVKMTRENRVNSGFIMAAVDFFRTYADRTHHGKEEDILFRDMAGKQVSVEHDKVMDELVQEHIYARKTVKALCEATESYTKGKTVSIKEIITCVEALVALYPRHIEKEDKHFFYPIMEYFSREEQDDMLREFWEFDKNMIHEKYQKVVEGWEV